MFKSYQKVLRLLRKKCPPAFPVYVRRVKMGDTKDGYCSKVNDKFQIRINKSLSEATTIDTLLHEWSHARCWNHLHDSMSQEEFIDQAHNAAWGIAYSEVYQIYEKNC